MYNTHNSLVRQANSADFIKITSLLKTGIPSVAPVETQKKVSMKSTPDVSLLEES